MPKRILLAILVLFVAPVSFAQDDAIHDELRGLLTGIESAVNEQRYGDIAQYFDAELAVPFVPALVWPYLSLYVLFFVPPFILEPKQMDVLGRSLVGVTVVAGIVFLLFPAQLGFERQVPADPFYASLFEGLFAVDHPHNLVPSLHVAFSGLILITLIGAVETRVAKAILAGWLVLLCLSTILVHQHHLLDIATGLLVAVAAYRVGTRRRQHA